ncbi:hypothetical protein LZ30DRAFT_694360 [Colletotrichum cereale]|nr:hypothetical protein LZ30DRAFT_694360 [Colletotrichum cereale]
MIMNRAKVQDTSSAPLHDNRCSCNTPTGSHREKWSHDRGQPAHRGCRRCTAVYGDRIRPSCSDVGTESSSSGGSEREPDRQKQGSPPSKRRHGAALPADATLGFVGQRLKERWRTSSRHFEQSPIVLCIPRHVGRHSKKYPALHHYVLYGCSIMTLQGEPWRENV